MDTETEETQLVAPAPPATNLRRRARFSAAVPDEIVEKYLMARAFLLGEWFGASTMVASFTLLYLLQFGTTASTTVTYAVCLTALALGTGIYFRSRRYYHAAEFPYATRWHVGAAVTAGSAGIFWFLFVFLVTLAWLGITVLPD